MGKFFLSSQSVACLLSLYSQAWHPTFSPRYDVLNDTNHEFYESLRHILSLHKDTDNCNYTNIQIPHAGVVCIGSILYDYWEYFSTHSSLFDPPDGHWTDVAETSCFADFEQQFLNPHALQSCQIHAAPN